MRKLFILTCLVLSACSKPAAEQFTGVCLSPFGPIAMENPKLAYDSHMVRMTSPDGSWIQASYQGCVFFHKPE